MIEQPPLPPPGDRRNKVLQILAIITQVNYLTSQMRVETMNQSDAIQVAELYALLAVRYKELSQIAEREKGN